MISNKKKLKLEKEKKFPIHYRIFGLFLFMLSIIWLPIILLIVTFSNNIKIKNMSLNNRYKEVFNAQKEILKGDFRNWRFNN